MTALNLTRDRAGTQARLLRQLTGEGVLRLITRIDIDRLLIDPAGVRSGIAWVYLGQRTFDDPRPDETPVFKIGRTKRPPATRMREHGSGLPDGIYQPVDMELVTDPVAVEARLKEAIRPYKQGLSGDEFFRADLENATRLFREALTEADLPKADIALDSSPEPRPRVRTPAPQPKRYSKDGIRIPLKTLKVPADHREPIERDVIQAIRQKFHQNSGENVPKAKRHLAAGPALVNRVKVSDARRKVVEKAVARWMSKNVSPADPERLRKLARRKEVQEKLPWEILLLYPSAQKLASWAARCAPRDQRAEKRVKAMPRK